MFACRTLVVAACLLVSSGCAYKNAMGEGARHEGSGDLVAAAASYEQALAKKPDEEVAQRARERVVLALVEQALHDATEALSAGDFETAMERLTIPPRYDDDRPEVYVLTQQAREDMARLYQTFWAAEDKGPAYAMAVRTRKLFPDSPHLDGAFSDLRTHYAVASAKITAAHEYSAALATLRIILTYEPDRIADIAGQEQSIIEAWGAHLATKGTASARARKHGAAAAWFARAYEVSPNPEYLEKSREIVSRLQTEAGLSVSLSVAGDRKRAPAMREGILAGLAGIPDTAVVTRSAKLAIRVQVGSSKCRETDVVTPASKDYVSGQVQQPNPEWQRLTTEIETQRQYADSVSTSAAQLQADFFAADQSVKAIDTQVQAANLELGVANQAVGEAQVQLDGATRHIYQMQADLAAHQAAGNYAVVDQIRAQLGQVNGVAAQWNGELQRRQQYANLVHQQVQGLNASRASVVDTAVRSKAALDAAVAEQQAVTYRTTELSTTLSATPQQVWTDVHALHTYDLHDWTRSCEAPVRVTLRPTWDVGVQTSASYAPSHATTDRAYRGHTKAAVIEDPKAFPDSDADLLTRGDAATLIEVNAWLGTVADDHFSVRRGEATQGLVADPIAGTTELVRLFTGARNRLDEPTLMAFRTHLRSEFGLENMELLSPLP